MDDFGRNGTYLVFRQLQQHVAEFWRFLDEATRRPEGASDPEARARLGAKFVGRWMSGAPLVKYPSSDPHAGTSTFSQENDFAYYETDAHGFACPVGSHIRRSNPRDALGPDAETALKSANRHRILRRGRSYGHRLDDPFVEDGTERGLHFICLNGDLERQFEFIQQTWVNNTTFAGLHGETDPLVGNQDDTGGRFTVQEDPLRSRVHNLRSFVTVKGGAYFFLPGLNALRYLASL
jgi:Dyp-type peroxidase family